MIFLSGLRFNMYSGCTRDVLGAGEREAIALAAELSADALLMDDRDGRLEAGRRGISVAGTLRVLADASEHGFADLADQHPDRVDA